MAKSLRRRHVPRAQAGRFVQAVRDSDRAVVHEMILRLSRSRPWLAPVALAVGGFASPQIRPAFTQARLHLLVVLGSGGIIGILLELSTVVVTRWGVFWFGLSLSVVVGLMMVCYVAVPARLIGVKVTQSKRDKLTASAVTGAVGAVICTPPYALGRIGLIMLGSQALFIPGVILLVIGLTLQAGATGAVKTVEMSVKLISGSRPGGAAEGARRQGPP